MPAHVPGHDVSHCISLADGLLSVAFTNLRGSPLAQTQPLSGIFTTVCDASRMAAADSSRDGNLQSLQDTMAASSALVLLLTRADTPAHTEANLRALLGCAPIALKVPLVLLTTAPDLHQGVQQWLSTLPGQASHCAAFLSSGLCTSYTRGL